MKRLLLILALLIGAVGLQAQGTILWIVVMSPLLKWLSQGIFGGPSSHKPLSDGQSTAFQVSRPLRYVLCLAVECNHMMIGVQWFGKSLFDAPPFTDPCFKSPSLERLYLFPLRNSVGLAFKFKDMVLSFVVGLKDAISPSNVSRFIVTIYVYAIQGVLGTWTWSNIAKEQAKISSPRRIHPYASSAIIRPIITQRIRAAILSSLPRAILASVAAPMFKRAMSQSINTSATAARGAFAIRRSTKIIAGNYDDLPAFTATLPIAISIWWRDTFKDSQSPEYFAIQRLCSWHVNIIT